MSSLDDIIGECQKDAEIKRVAEIESVTKIAPDPLCLVVRVNAARLERFQIEDIAMKIRQIFRDAGATPPPILVADQFVEFTAIPKSLLVDDT